MPLASQPASGSLWAAPNATDAEPTGLALCWHCGRVEDHPDPDGWVTVAPDGGDHAVTTALGVCPGCLASHYRFPDRPGGAG